MKEEGLLRLISPLEWGQRLRMIRQKKKGK